MDRRVGRPGAGRQIQDNFEGVNRPTPLSADMSRGRPFLVSGGRNMKRNVLMTQLLTGRGRGILSTDRLWSCTLKYIRNVYVDEFYFSMT